MSYDIPDKIQYKEKIVFGLDFKQLGYFCVFGVLAFLSLSLPLEGDAKLVAPIFLVILGAGFIFLNLEKFLLDRFAFYSNVRFGGALDKKVQEFIGVRKVENDAAYLNNGELRAVLAVYPINFQNLDEGRKKSVVLNYRDFLNQLSHPVQVLVRTVNVNLAEYYVHKDEKIRQSNNQQLIALYEEFKLWEQNFVKENQVKERLYYVVVPYDPDASILAKQKSAVESIKDSFASLINPKHKGFSERQDEFHRKELADRVSIIQQKLLNCGLVSRRLSTNELISLYMSYFDAYVEVNEDYLSRIVVAKTFFDKKNGEKND